MLLTKIAFDAQEYLFVKLFLLMYVEFSFILSLINITCFSNFFYRAKKPNLALVQEHKKHSCLPLDHISLYILLCSEQWPKFLLSKFSEL